MASYRLAIRRDTAANWSASNPVLAQGEFGYEVDTGSLKIGDGVTQWNSLPAYTSIAGADLDNLGDVDTAGKVVGDVLKWDGVNWSTAADNDTIYADADVDTHLNSGTATTNQVLSWDGADYAWSDDHTTAGYATTLRIEKQYRWDGALEVNTGVARLYIPADCTGYSVTGYLGTASSADDVTVDVLLNGSVDTTLTIPALSLDATATSPVVITEGSYVTIDITGIGTASTDLYLTLTFERT